MTRVGAVDIGTNSARLLVADVGDGGLEDVLRRSTVTRLGEGVDAGRRLLEESIERTLRVLAGYRDDCARAGAEHVLAVATSAARDAVNGGEFLDVVRERFGFETRLLSGEQEAELTRRGVGAVAAGTLVVDIGGGSTELILSGFRTSIDVGSVRLTERFLHGDPPTPGEVASATAYVRELLPELDVTAAIGVAGTVTQLHAIAGELLTPTVERELARLAALTVAERAAVPGMDPARAPVIVGGAIVVREVLRRYSLPGLGWSLRDILDGIALTVLDGLESSRE